MRFILFFFKQKTAYEMNTMEFAMKGDAPYAIDFLNPAPDFERDRITQFYFDMVVEKMARLVIDRALNGAPSNPWPRWEEMLGGGAAAGFTGAPKAAAQTAAANVSATAPAGGSSTSETPGGGAKTK